MFDIQNLDCETIAYYWQRARLCAESIWSACYVGINIGQAKLDQNWLRQWVKEAREAGLLYNGRYDEFITMKL